MKLCQILDTQEWCAIKIMKDMNSLDKLEKFLNEARLLSLCSESSIVGIKAVSISGTLISAGHKRPVVYHVTNYAKYGELYNLIKDTGSFSERLARTYFVQLLRGNKGWVGVGLEYLHSIGISHRDVKPENLLLDHDLRLVIADFGSAAKCRTEDHKEIEFDSAIVVGSQQYNAPEINMAKVYLGEKADVFSAGICLFLMMVGSAPFREASLKDPYYKLLSKKDKSAYWAIYAETPLSDDFKDLFGKISEGNVGKRLDLGEVKAHPWMKGPIYTQEELLDVMRDRLELSTKIRNLEMQEKLVKQRWNHRPAMSWAMVPQMEMASFDKSLQTDAFFSRCLAECAEVNTRLEKQKLVVSEATSTSRSTSTIHSDDQMAVGSTSDDALKDSNVKEVQGAARRVEHE